MELHRVGVSDGIRRDDVLRFYGVDYIVVLVPHDVDTVGAVEKLNMDVQKASRLRQKFAILPGDIRVAPGLGDSNVKAKVGLQDRQGRSPADTVIESICKLSEPWQVFEFAILCRQSCGKALLNVQCLDEGREILQIDLGDNR